MVPLLIHGDARRIPLADGVLQTVCCSPPYFGLRQYSGLGPNQLGSEKLPDCLGWTRGEMCDACYLCHLRTIMAEVWRVLRDDGTLWIVISDSYVTNPGNGRGGESVDGGKPHRSGEDRSRLPGLRPKSLLGIPQRFALAMVQDGWILRNEIIWAKSNAMPESTKDRVTRAHEQVFLFTKSPRYFFDQAAERQPYSREYKDGPGFGGFANKAASKYGQAGLTSEHNALVRAGASPRSVWSLPTEPTSDAHFATYPTALARKCLRLGASLRGCCPVCRAAWVRVVERRVVNTEGWGLAQKDHHHGIQQQNATLRNNQGRMGDSDVYTTGWRPSCPCPPHDPVPCLVADIFSGSGTTCQVAQELGMQGIGLELSPDYVRLSQQRLMRHPQLTLVTI